jgi:hypothetical protein
MPGPTWFCGTEADKSMPDRLVFARNSQNNGQLYVWALTSAQATEMSFNQSILITRINAWFGSNVVGNLRVTAFQARAIVPQAAPRIG